MEVRRPTSITIGWGHLDYLDHLGPKSSGFDPLFVIWASPKPARLCDQLCDTNKNVGSPILVGFMIDHVQPKQK